MINKDYYTTGEMADLAGITYKSIRVYVEKGLLVPDQITETGYKLFSQKSVERLQRILLFKYLDFSLEEINKLLDEEDVNNSLNRQSELIDSKITHLTQIKNAVEEMKLLSAQDNWDKMIEIMKLTSQREEVVNQYAKSEKLEKRINIHEYSTSDIEWYAYLLDKCELKAGMNILDIGCGNAQLWYEERDNLPENINIYLVDNSQAMISAAKKLLLSERDYYSNKNIKFHYEVCDAVKVGELKEIESIKFQRIMCNHMLYHIEDSDRKKLFAKVREMLAKDGSFIASTIGDGHMKELWNLATQYDKKVKIPGWFASGFSLENGKQQLDEYFDLVTMYHHDNNLLVPDWKVVYEYMTSLPGGIEKIMRKSEGECIEFLRNKITEKTPLFIEKNTGVFVAKNE